MMLAGQLSRMSSLKSPTVSRLTLRSRESCQSWPSSCFIVLLRPNSASLAQPFLLDERGVGGLALTTSQVGTAYGVVGPIMLLLGGIAGGILASRHGLKHWLWWMALAINVPNAVYVFLSQVQPESYTIVVLSVAIEQLGYGFGFSAFMLFLLYVSQGEHETSHYAICTGFMGAGHDVARHVLWVAGGFDRLPTLFHLGDAIHNPQLPRMLVCRH